MGMLTWWAVGDERYHGLHQPTRRHALLGAPSRHLTCRGGGSGHTWGAFDQAAASPAQLQPHSSRRAHIGSSCCVRSAAAGFSYLHQQLRVSIIPCSSSHTRGSMPRESKLRCNCALPAACVSVNALEMLPMHPGLRDHASCCCPACCRERMVGVKCWGHIHAEGVVCAWQERQTHL